MVTAGTGPVDALRRGAHGRPLGLSWVLACGLSWAWWLPMAVSGPAPAPGTGWPTHLSILLLALLLAGSVVLTTLYRSAGGSVLVVGAWHTALDLGSATRATAGSPPIALAGGAR
jgi:hypothetical protein